MSRRHEDPLIQCPYYRYDSDGCIHCEGVCGLSTLRLGFSVPSGRLEYKKAHCRSDWPACAIAQMQNRRYGYEP